MVPYKIFIQMVWALFLSTDPNVDAHLCAGIRDAKNYTQLVEQCDISSIDHFNCNDLLKIKCGFE